MKIEMLKRLASCSVIGSVFRLMGARFIRRCCRFFLLMISERKTFIKKKKLSKKARLSEVEVLQKLRLTHKPIRVAFFVVFDSVFPGEAILRVMLEDKNFQPFIVAIPDVIRGPEQETGQLDKTFSGLSLRYQGKCRVMRALKDEFGRYIDFSNDYDLLCTANPYHAMTDHVYTIEHAIEMSKLTFFISYGYQISKWGLHEVLNADSANIVWKLYLDAPQMLNDAKRVMGNKGVNAVLSGYAKMDRLATVGVCLRKRKKIIISPHHTILMSELPLSNFLLYADFFLKLPNMFKDVDFVFRPHPLLRVTLARDDVWGKEKTDRYFESISSFDNVEYQDGGDYFETFVNSDGIIHDCGSFAAEYLYTGHPACFIIRDSKVPKKFLNQLMNDCLAVHYKAYSEEDIVDYIENVVLAENDPMKESRDKFAKEKLMFNYPHVSEAIVADIKKALGRA